MGMICPRGDSLKEKQMVNENDITKEHYDAALTRHGCKNKLNGSVVYIGHGIEVWQRIAPAHQPNYRRSHLAHILECKEEVDLAGKRVARYGGGWRRSILRRRRSTMAPPIRNGG
jgi:hypothetical protein